MARRARTEIIVLLFSGASERRFLSTTMSFNWLSPEDRDDGFIVWV